MPRSCQVSRVTGVDYDQRWQTDTSSLSARSHTQQQTLQGLTGRTIVSLGLSDL